ncbi:integrin alpha-PS1 isoform X2 [Galleria mellonella]|uniref:Integrin alpha-PS1 isoform X2 n=1 Tax=Galleria mellonella TaxID=7137 RepID=A0A6J1WYT4_GALME|nr:integrin alpha-PS1 isoform X2 [Galleria mellonella]
MMAAKIRCGGVIFFCILFGVHTFNLEPRIPVIKYGEAGSYFGFSVAEHLTFNSDGSKTSWLLVGAPLGQNLQPNITQSGALFKCGLTPAEWDCQQVITDGKSNPEGYNLTQPHSDEQKKGQWLGVSVRSQGPGKKAVVCAHRYIRKVLEAQYGQGLCYTLSNELKLIDAWEPCRGRSVAREHEEFGFCQVGTSSSLLDDDTLVMGSPGPYTWRGTLFVSDAKDDLLERDNTVYLAPVEDGQSPVEKYSYLGMSVIGAKFFDAKSSYAAGAPRSHGTGQVVFFSKREIQNWTLTNVNFLGLKHIIDGEQFGSSFGYEVSAADVNGDGLPDLLVGAPFYFSRDTGGAVYLYLNMQYTFKSKYDVKLTGKPESQFGISIANAGDLNKDGCEDVAIGSPYAGNGIVYIYLGDRKNGLNTKPDQVIEAEDLPRYMKTFGYSLSGGTDLDGNGYPDLLVGAYENSSVALIRTRPIIDIQTWVVPKIVNIDPTQQSCDKNPESNNTCFYFQACCIIRSLVESTENKIHKLNYVIEAETFANERKFSRIFFHFEKTNIVNGTIILGKDIEYCIEHIAYLKNNTRDIQTPIRIRLTYILEHVQPQYSTYGVLPNIDEYPVLNATATTTFSASFLNDCGEDGICNSDLVVYPVLLLPKADDKSYALILGEEEEIKLAVDVNNNGDSAYEAQLFVQHSPNLHYIAANITDKRLICGSVNKTLVSCMLENPFKQQPEGTPPIILRFDARALEDSDPSVSFTVWANSTSKELYPDKTPEEVKALVIKNAELPIHGVARPEQVFYGGEVKGESAMTYFDDIGPAVVHTYQVSNEGRWRVPAVQVRINWPHEVQSNEPRGKWLLYPENITAIDEETGHIHGKCFAQEDELNPLKLKSRPGLAEPLLENLKMDPMLKSGKHAMRSSDRRHNYTKKAYSYSSAVENRVRRRRASDIVATAEAYNDDGQRKYIETMSCAKKTAKCILFQCIIYPLARKQSVSITIRARLWNSTLIEEYPRVSYVGIVSSASVDIPDHYNIYQVSSDNTATVVTIAYPDLQISKATEVPLWVIIISVIIGLIVLVLLIIFLWKLGFFKRSRPDPTLSGNLEKNNHEASPLFDHNR